MAHEAALKAQAKKMNVDSLRSAGKDNEESAEVKIAKVAITNVLLWFTIWTPYAAISALPALGYQSALTPLLSQLPSFMGNKCFGIFLPILSELNNFMINDFMIDRDSKIPFKSLSCIYVFF